MDVLAIKTSVEVIALGPDAVDDVDSVHSMLDQLLMGVGPKPDGNMTDFFKAVVKKFENFFEKNMAPAGAQGSGAPMQTPRGRSAMQAQVAEVKQRFEAGERSRDLIRALQPLKTFAWMLSDEERASYKSMIFAVSRGLGDSGVSGADALADEHAEFGIVEAGVASAIAASVSDDVAPHVQPSKKQKAALEKVNAEKGRMLKFFVGAGGKSS